MALTAFQRDVCRLLAENRIRSGESYVAGAAALNELLRAPRVSRDLDLFHDTAEALDTSWRADRASLEHAGYRVHVVRERGGLVEVTVERGGDSVVVQWTRDSVYRFFPLVRHEELGLTLHPFDLATNKLLALVGRAEPRDLVDALACHERLQPLGYLAWAACGKDPGFSPRAILEHAAASTRYAAVELAGLAFDGAPPDPADLLRRWHDALRAAREIVSQLPAEQAGKAVLAPDARPFRGDAAELEGALGANALLFHEGAIKGAFPQIVR
jgi:hypothetical protein